MSHAFREGLARWVSLVCLRPGLVLVLLAVLTAAAGWVAVDRFAINSDLSGLIDQSARWRTDFDRYADAFPDRVDTLVLVVSGDERSRVEKAARAIRDAMAARQELFRSVQAPAVEPFFRDHALLYLSEDELESLIDRLAQAQPLLAAVAERPRLDALFSRLAQALDEPEAAGAASASLGVDAVLRLLERSADALLDGADPTVAWRDQLLAEPGPVLALVSARAAPVPGPRKGSPNDAPAVDLDNAQVVAGARALLAELSLPPGITVQLTGEIALAHDEILAATTGVQRAGWISVVLLVAVLLLGVRSAKVVLATFLLLLTGVTWTTAFAMLTVGEFNTLSIVFLVMFFGLGVDFAVHFSLRYQEAWRALGPLQARARIAECLVTATASVGPAICLCALTTGLAFLAFWPTPYRGLADLGVISAGGMVIAALLTFTLLPALYVVLGPVRAPELALAGGSRMIAALISRRALVLMLVSAIAVAGGFGAARSYFDFSVLALRDEGSESMRAFRQLQQEGLVTDYSLSVMTAMAEAPEALVTLPTVGDVLGPAAYLPARQEDKLLLLEDAADLFWDLFERRAHPLAADAGSPRQGAARLLAALEARGEGSHAGLIADLRDIVSGSDAQLLIWERAVLDDLLQELDWLERALAVAPVQFEDLPAGLRRQLRSPDGDYLLQVNPARDLSRGFALKAFVESVRAVVPSATGRPVIEWGVGQIVVQSFLTALLLAVAAVLGVLWARYRRWQDALLILLPLALALVLTLAISTALGSPLNMASVLVLPLIFGLGVDNGIHVVDRYRDGLPVAGLAGSSTPRAVLLSTLTTIGAFASLMLSPHQGTASIGLLLTVAVSLILLLTLFLLPLLLSYDSGTALSRGGATG